MTLHEHRMHARGNRGSREERRALGSAASRLACARKLRAVRRVEADWRRLARRIVRQFQFHHVAKAKKVVDEPAVAEGRAALGEQDVAASRFFQLSHGAAHFVRREELAFLDVHGVPVLGCGFAAREQKIGLAAQERGHLQEINDSRDFIRLTGLVNVGRHGDAKVALHDLKPLHTLCKAGAARGLDGGPICFVEARLEDVLQARRLAGVAHDPAYFQAHFE